MTEINLPKLLELLECKSPQDCWLSTDCYIDDSGIRLKRPLDKEDNQIINGEEWKIYRKYQDDIQLDLPCTMQQFEDWIRRNEFLEFLPNSPKNETNDISKKSFKNQARDKDFEEWFNQVGGQSHIDSITLKEIKTQLEVRNAQLWASGFYDWWKIQKIYKKQAGRPKKNKSGDFLAKNA